MQVLRNRDVILQGWGGGGEAGENMNARSFTYACCPGETCENFPESRHVCILPPYDRFARHSPESSSSKCKLLATETARSVVRRQADTARSTVMGLADTDLSLKSVTSSGWGKGGSLGSGVASSRLSRKENTFSKRWMILSMWAEISFIFSKSSRLSAAFFPCLGWAGARGQGVA